MQIRFFCKDLDDERLMLGSILLDLAAVRLDNEVGALVLPATLSDDPREISAALAILERPERRRAER